MTDTRIDEPADSLSFEDVTAPESASPRTSPIPILYRTEGVLLEEETPGVADAYRVVSTYDAKRCHCGSFVAATQNVNNRNAASWKWCNACIKRKSCREADRCATRAELVARTSSRIVRSGLDRPLGVVLGLAVAGALLFAWQDLVPLALLCAVVAGAVDALLIAVKSPLLGRLAGWHLSSLTRSVVRAGIVVVCIAGTGIGAAPWTTAVVLIAVGVMFACRMLVAHIATLQRTSRDTRVEWANLPGVPSDFQPRATATRAADASTALDVLLWASLLLAALLDSSALVACGAGALAVGESIVLLVAAVPALRARRTRRAAQSAEDLLAVQGALDVLEPRTLFSFSGTDAVPHLGAVVTLVADAAAGSKLLVLREHPQFARHRGASMPVLLLPRGTDTELLDRDSIELVVHGAPSPKNNHLLRRPGARHCLLDLGRLPIQPVSRTYDEIWVTSDERRQEYLALADGFEPDQLVVVPSLHALDEAAARADGSDVAEHQRRIGAVLREATERARRTRRDRAAAALALETAR